MSTRTLEEAFARFRDERDLAALAEVFDRTAPQLFELARHLARGRDEAEDLVQATFMAALEGAERFEQGRALVPWLLGILANLARRAHQRRGALGGPSAEFPDPRAADPAAHAAEREFRSALEGALGRLPATYREVLASHFGEGHAPEEIARRLGRAPGTVRVQLHRGLKHLRRLLPAGFALGALGLLSSRGLAAVRADVLRAARGGSARLGPALMVGGLLVAKKLALVAVVFLIAASAWWLARAGERAEAPLPLAVTQPTAQRAAPARTELAPIENGARSVQAAGAGGNSERASAEPYGGLTVVLTWWDGTPAAGLPLCFYPWAERQPHQAFQQRVTDAEGRVRVERLHAGAVLVEVERMWMDGRFQLQVERGTEREERITLARNCDLVGRVRDRDGVLVAGAQLWVKQDLLSRGHAAERSQADGSFRVRSVPEGFGLLASADGAGSSETATWDAFETLDPNTRWVELRLRGESAELEGSVRDFGGKALAGARVAVRCANDLDGRTLRHWPDVLVVSDHEGSFRLGGLHRGSADVSVVAANLAPMKERVMLEEGLTTRLAIRLDTGFSVRGTVVAADGRPAHEASIRAEPTVSDVHEACTTTDEDGHYTLEFLPAGPIVLVAAQDEASAQAPRAQKRLTGRVGEQLEWNVVFGSGPSIRGRARDESGRALVGWWVRALPAQGTGAAVSALVATDEHGVFVLPDLAEAPFNVFLYAPEDSSPEMPRAQAELALPGGADIELVVRGELEPSAFLLGRVLDPAGLPARPSHLSARRKDELDSVGDPAWLEGERFRIGPMLSGEYELSISVAGFPDFHREFSLAEGEEHDLGDIALARTGSAKLTLRGPGGAPLGKPMSVFLMNHEGLVSRLSSADGVVYESDPLFPGAYSLRIMAGVAAPDQPLSVEIRPGETTVTDLPLVAARTVFFDFRTPEEVRLPRRARFELRAAKGTLLLELEAQRSRSPGSSHELLGIVCALPFGRFDYSLRSADGWSAAGTIEVQTGTEPVQHVTVSLSR